VEPYTSPHVAASDRLVPGAIPRLSAAVKDKPSVCHDSFTLGVATPAFEQSQNRASRSPSVADNLLPFGWRVLASGVRPGGDACSRSKDPPRLIVPRGRVAPEPNTRWGIGLGRGLPFRIFNAEGLGFQSPGGTQRYPPEKMCPLDHFQCERHGMDGGVAERSSSGKP
jgi:hypothetical protein